MEQPWSRDQELRLRELRQLKEHRGLNDAEGLELAKLQSLYQQFLDEGAAKMRLGRNVEQYQYRETAEGGALSSITRGIRFWGAQAVRAVPLVIGRSLGLVDHEHWNWITDRLILGGLPVVTKVAGGVGNHTQKLHAQCVERGAQIGLIVSCVEPAEFTGYNVPIVEYATLEHFKRDINPSVCQVQLPIVDGTALVPLEAVRDATRSMHNVITNFDAAVYVHCRAGVGRSWMVLMCYLVTYGNMSFEAAESMVRSRRKQVNPSESQRQFVRDFAELYLSVKPCPDSSCE